jgi:hypothetical protein
LAFWPVYSWYRRQITSEYLASNSISRLARPSRSHAISVEPDPPKTAISVEGDLWPLSWKPSQRCFWLR